MEELGPERKRQRRNSPDGDSDLLLCARWCQIHPSHDANNLNEVRWDSARIKCFLPDDERKDAERMRRLVEGTDISPQFHPLLFEHAVSAQGSKWARLRSLPFFEALVADAGSRHDYDALSADEKRIVAVGVRDLCLASMADLLSQHERNLLDKLVGFVDELSAVGSVDVEGMTISFHPSANFKSLRFIEDLDAKLQGCMELTPFFAQVLDSPRLFAVFVDPAELSFHNFENIVPLDRWIEAQMPDASMATLEVVDEVQVHPERNMWTAKLRGSESDLNLIKRISDLDLYVAPLNKTMRGGERFIFHSALLSKALTRAVSASGLLGLLADGGLALVDFAFVNYVFRCNRFAPGDAKFTAHRDTPYYDASRSQVSKYTLLVYLSSGENGEGVLEIDSVATLREVAEFTCVVFDQRYEHEGRSFIDTNKIFLRTELVFSDRDFVRHPPIASLFSTACYMTAQSVFDEQLTSYAHACFERANAMHWAVEKAASPPSVYLYKQYRGIRFLTNGYDYWFAPIEGGNAVDCAMVAVLDYFNVKLGARGAFRSLCRSTTVREAVITSAADAFQFMSSREATPADDSAEVGRLSTKFRRLTASDVDNLFRDSPDRPFFPRPRPSWQDEEDEENEDDDNEGCCPMHTWTTFDAWKSEDVADEYRRCRNFTRRRLFGAPLLLLGRELIINEKQIEVVGDKILFHTSDTGTDSDQPRRFNFAACWGDSAVGADLFVGVDADRRREIAAPKLVVPPVVFHEYAGCGWHLVLDFFRNDWMVRTDDARPIVIPVITNDVPEELGDDDEVAGGPFWRMVRELAGDDEDALRGSFWTRDSEEELAS